MAMKSNLTSTRQQIGAKEFMKFWILQKFLDCEQSVQGDCLTAKVDDHLRKMYLRDQCMDGLNLYLVILLVILSTNFYINADE